MLVLGTQTGSLINHVYSTFSSHAPEVGMGATMLGWTDRHAATIVEVSKDGRKVGIIRDIATRIDKNGMSEMQEYAFERGTGKPSYYTLRKNGKWVAQGQGFKNGSRIVIGARDEYYDFSF